MQPRHCRMVGYQGYQGCKPVSMRVSLIPRQRFMGYQAYQARAGFRLAHFQICPMAYPRKPRKPQLLGQTYVACHILTGLERGGKVQLTQTEMDAIEAAAQARADKRGTSLEAERSKLMQSMQASRSAMKSVDANIRRGEQALAKALNEKTTVHRAMFRNGPGWVDFVWGMLAA